MTLEGIHEFEAVRDLILRELRRLQSGSDPESPSAPVETEAKTLLQASRELADAAQDLRTALAD